MIMSTDDNTDFETMLRTSRLTPTLMPLSSSSSGGSSYSDKSETEIIHTIMQKNPESSTGSYADKVQFFRKSHRRSATDYKILFAHDNGKPVYCHVLKSKGMSDSIQFTVETGDGDGHKTICSVDATKLDLLEPFDLIVQSFPPPGCPQPYISAFTRACFIVKGCRVNFQNGPMGSFKKTLRRAIRCIDEAPSTQHQNDATVTDDNAEVSDDSIGATTASAKVQNENTSEDEEDETIREDILETYLQTKQDHQSQKAERGHREQEHYAAKKKFKELQDQLKIAEKEVTESKRKLAAIDTSLAVHSQELKRMKRQMTGDEGYELAKREMQIGA